LVQILQRLRQEIDGFVPCGGSQRTFQHQEEQGKNRASGPRTCACRQAQRLSVGRTLPSAANLTMPTPPRRGRVGVDDSVGRRRRRGRIQRSFSTAANAVKFVLHVLDPARRHGSHRRHHKHVAWRTSEAAISEHPGRSRWPRQRACFRIQCETAALVGDAS